MIVFMSLDATNFYNPSGLCVWKIIAIEQPASSQIPSLSFCARRFSLSLRFWNCSNCSGCIHRNLRTCMDRESQDQQPACYQGIITQSITHVPYRDPALSRANFQWFPKRAKPTASETWTNPVPGMWDLPSAWTAVIIAAAQFGGKTLWRRASCLNNKWCLALTLLEVCSHINYLLSRECGVLPSLSIYIFLILFHFE